MRSLFISLLITTSLYSNELYNTNLLAAHGIDPDILNTTISNTRQHAAYRVHIKHLLLKESKQSTLEYNVIVDPFPSYGTDMQIQLPKERLDDVTRDIRKVLDEIMGVQLYVQHSTLYNIDSLELIQESSEETIIRFTFNEKTLPRELKHFKKCYGYVHIVNGLLTKIEIKNVKRFEMRDIEVDDYRKTIYYKAVKTGGYLISKEELVYQGTYNELSYKESVMGKVTEYWNAKRQLITFDEGVTDKIVNIQENDHETIAVDLDRTFPLLGQAARKAGYDLPKPFGVTLVNMFQDTNMHMTSFEINGVPIDFNKIIDGDSTYRSLTYAPLVRADLWVLPFVSFGFILGATDTDTDVTLASDSGLTLPVIGEIIPPGSSINLDPLHTNALLYGVGATVAGGFDNYFTTIDFQYVIAYTPEADVSIDMMIITPLVGYTLTDYNTRLFIGAQYQRLAESLTFSVPVNGETLSGKIGLRSDEWAGVIGTDYSFTRNWSANLLYSQGVDRRNMVLGIAYRF